MIVMVIVMIIKPPDLEYEFQMNQLNTLSHAFAL